MGERMFTATKIKEAIKKVKDKGFFAVGLDKLEDELGLHMTEEEFDKREEEKQKNKKEEAPETDAKKVFKRLEDEFKVG